MAADPSIKTMSWSVSYLGKAEKVAEALAAQSEQMSGQSKVEFDDALPLLQGLVKQNFGQHESALIKLDANGSGSANAEGEQLNRTCSVTLQTMYTKVLV